MAGLRRVHGVVYAPHFVFFRCAGVCSAAVLLRALGLEGYERTAAATAGLSGRPYLLWTEDDAWIHLMDDRFYTLWHSADFRERVRELARGCAVFSFWLGDADRSYGFSAYQEGELVRRRRVTSPHQTDLVVVEDAGTALPGEGQALVREQEGEDMFPVLCDLARAQGIDLSHEGKAIVGYVWRGRISPRPGGGPAP